PIAEATITPWCSGITSASGFAIRAARRKGRGPPSSSTHMPATFGISQSRGPPRAMVSAMPKPVASSTRQGSRPMKPGRTYRAQSRSSAQRGSLRACSRVTRNARIGRTVESAMPVGPARQDRTGKGAGGYPDDMKKGSCRCLEDGSLGCLLFSLADDRLVASADGCMERRDDTDCPLPPRRAAGGVRGHGGDSAPTGRTAELLAELLDPTGLDDPLLGARIERMRVRRDVELEQRILLAVVHLDGLAGIGRRPGDELEAARHVLEDDVAILWVDTFFHGSLTVGLAAENRKLYRVDRQVQRAGR